MHTVLPHPDAPGHGPCDGHQAVAPPWDFPDDQPIPFWPTTVRDRSVTPLTQPYTGQGGER